jgi:uncharacterized OB-fold protein
MEATTIEIKATGSTVKYKTCPACGRLVDSSWSYCPYCGQALG